MQLEAVATLEELAGSGRGDGRGLGDFYTKARKRLTDGVAAIPAPP